MYEGNNEGQSESKGDSTDPKLQKMKERGN